MKAWHLYLFCILLFAAGCGGGGGSGSAPVAIAPAYTLCGTQYDTLGNPVADAKVSIIVNSKRFDTRTSPTGEYKLTINQFDSPYIPDTFSYSVSKEGYIPVTYSRSKAETSCTGSDAAHEMVPLGPGTILLEKEPLTHHLGDSAFSGDINSRFQFMSAQGISYTKKFDATGLPSQFRYATITFMHKGVQTPGFNDIIQINGGEEFLINMSDPHGDFLQFRKQVDAGIFKDKDNLFLIQAGKSGNDIDDFEFQNVVIQFHN